jgi:medium-chain acyl-[acyl-carrier-protein] hydrolase
MELIITTDYSVRSTDVGPSGTLRPDVLMNLLQEIAGTHAAQLNLGFEDLAEKNMTWVSKAYHIKIARLPHWKENILIRSWPCEIKKILSIRDFEILDSNANIIISASSSWLVVDIQTKRPLRPLKSIGKYSLRPERALQTTFDKIPDVTSPHYQRVYQARFTELDMNQHVNNAVYLVWALETLPEEFLRDYSLKEIELEFKSEVMHNHHVQAVTQCISSAYETKAIHLITNENTSAEAARIRTTWIKRDN